MDLSKEMITLAKFYLVGGAVREIVRGFPDKIKDWDFAVEAKDFADMRLTLNLRGFEIYLETPEYLTIRARAPKSGFTFAGMDMSNKTFDFTLCRTESDYTDGRHPDLVEVGTIEQDLSRRDFTMNAIAMDSSGTLIDPFNGSEDIQNKVIRLVGGEERLMEDSLRMLRAVRFSVQLGFRMQADLFEFLHDGKHKYLLDVVSRDRIRDELHKAFKINTLETLETLEKFHWMIPYFFEKGDMWLEPTFKGRKGLQKPTD
ncbi:tRNA nucleotidyltransferase [Arthrobacter phage Mimi]|nr:tRNA nucleotidyltransferase [Arthrobacter phage Mimi]